MISKKVEVLEIEQDFGGDSSAVCITLRDEAFYGSSITTKDNTSMLERGMSLTMLVHNDESRPFALYSKEKNIWIETNYNSDKEILPKVMYLLMLIPFGTLLLVENLLDVLLKKDKKRDLLKSTNPYWVYCSLTLSIAAVIGSVFFMYNVTVNDQWTWDQYVAISLMGAIALFINIKVWEKSVGNKTRDLKNSIKTILI
jgi:hypothetical protein